MHGPSVQVSLLLLVSTALSTANGKPLVSRTPTGQQIVSFTDENAVKFDNLDAGTGLGRYPNSLDSLGAYSLLYYDNLAVVNITADLAGLKPFSKPNVLGYDAESVSQGQQIMTSEFDDSITDYFNLKSFYFGCVLTDVGDVGPVPIPCSMSVIGFRDEERAASQIVTFQPDGSVSNLHAASPLNFRYQDVDRVTFDVVYADRELDFAVLFDNFEYDVVLKQGAQL
ncbi:hypothetical protein KC343_g7917 [Hortaea werneckii]|uniref:Uncharacterized protein n=1 Tax=Hortaea werneckii TaxID=91943 RepID=A0A3M7CSF2_HORWE|nr:hypothetical protein KC352_g15703 [Hortaea werneckii]KAI7562692.1 hypothetical protein KC317_g8241 [Hortaea werneckii]KAI7612426.1 hypothetical protein KC346_g7837 [Hortaea werneckii]KAI7621683.1 hypothetical protein KC343_g7917 [Hortaea werneckii]KAI7663597.1 hypothetical protein KC319_g7711 [Hortaea werneckii]